MRAVGPAILLLAAVIGLIVALLIGGGAVRLGQGDPGDLVRWGLPAAKLAVNLSAAVMIGPLVVALFALRPGDRAFERAIDLASLGAALFTLAGATTAFLTFLNAFPAEVSIGREFGAQLGRFLFELSAGQAWSMTVLMGAVVTLALFAWRAWTPVLLATALAVLALLPMATQGHAGDLAGHALAVNSMFLHMIAAAVWLGGLLLLAVLGEADAALLRRYSSLALLAFVVIAASGISRSLVTLQSWNELLSGYGLIVLAKTAILVLLGIVGAANRLRLIPRAAAAAPWFWRFVGVELALMGLASGAAAALARSPTPSRQQVFDLTPAQILTGELLPPELVGIRWLTEWKIDILWMLAAVFGMFFYLAAVLRLRRRGDRWPVLRTVLWMLGLLLLVWVTCGSINRYQEFLFSVHMLGHMLLGMGIPLLLVAGAPVTLALRAIRRRDDGTRGGREWILWAVHSPFSRVVTHPIFAGANFIISLWAFYFTDLFRWSLYEHLGHQWMTVHFLISGYLFTLSLVGTDPVPYRLPFPGRLVLLISTMAMHAFFGVALMMQTGLMVAEWFGSMGRTWGATPLQDQYVGGGIAWSVGEIPTLILAVAVAIMWSRSDQRLARRQDRHADRTGDQELLEYNERLARLAARDEGSGR